MQYSFIKARPKHLVGPEWKLVLFFFGAAFFILFSTYGFLVYKNAAFKNDIARLDTKASQLKRSMVLMDTELAFIEKRSGHAEQIFTANAVLKESIENLFDLIPDRIILSQVEMRDDALVMYGVTPNKEVYEFLLQAPLRSIFHQTHSRFYPIDNGWYSFVSTSYIEKEVKQ